MTALRFALAAAATLLVAAPAMAADTSILDPKTLKFVLPKDIKWAPGSPGAEVAVLQGDPQKPGELYVLLNKWKAGNNFSRPHFHENDRYIYVLSGTWWVGTGDVFDPENATVPMPAGSYVVHHAKQVHWDGAKTEDTIIAIVGIGPAASKPSPTAKIPPDKK